MAKLETLRTAYAIAKQHNGAPGIDGVTFAAIEAGGIEGWLANLRDELVTRTYRPLRNRRVEIPKRGGKIRVLGIPAVADRVAQTVVKMYLEEAVEPHFHRDSYGYRPGKSAAEALTMTRQRCWRYDWVIDLDIRGFFDNLDHALMRRAVGKYTQCRWILL